MTDRKRRTIAIVILAAVAAILAVVSLTHGPQIVRWFRFRREFEGLGLNGQGLPEYRHKMTGIVFVRLPGGRFRMGTIDVEHSHPDIDDEKPPHDVTLSPFLIAKHEVTKGQWLMIFPDSLGPTYPYYPQSDEIPIRGIPWAASQEFCRSTGLQLPTEAQWEYACRGGRDGKHGAPDSSLDAIAWYRENSGDEPHPVGEKQPNQFGVHDMLGNVKEWCRDVYDKEFYSKAAATGRDPVSTSGSESRALRGGSYTSWEIHCTCSTRSGGGPGPVGPHIGIRPVFELR